MACNLADQIPCFTEGETQLGYVGFADELESGEVLSGTPTVVDDDSTGVLTIGNQGLNSSEKTVVNTTHAANEAVVFTVSGFTASDQPRNGGYQLKVTVSTDSSPARTLVKYVRFTVQGSPS